MSDDQKPQGFAVTCPRCERAVIMQVHGQWHYDDPHGPPERWTAAECPYCGQAALYLQNHHGDVFGWDDYWRAYPPQNRLLDEAVPDGLRSDFSEARRCVEARCYTAGVIMARRVIEGICVEQGFKERNLYASLEKMRDDGVIDGRLFDWADVVREVGNAGAHPSGEAISRDDTTEVLAFVEALLDYLYVFQARYTEFKARRAAPNKPIEEF